MVKLRKSLLPSGVKINSENDYREGKVFHILAKDCYDKCYICEDKPISINVEHRVSHRGDKKLKYNWDNLFLACGHCNNIKLDKYDNILNPTNCDPEEHISLSIEITGKLIDRVQVKSLKKDESTLITAKLLERVYNGGTTDIKNKEASNLRDKHLMPDIQIFYQYIKNHRDEPDEGYDKDIISEIDRSAKFAAFKRKIIRDDPELSKEFADALI